MDVQLSAKQINEMVRHACFVERHDGPIPAEAARGLCCHIKSLASEVKILHDIIRDASPWFLEGQEDQRIANHYGPITPDCDDDK